MTVRGGRSQRGLAKDLASPLLLCGRSLIFRKMRGVDADGLLGNQSSGELVAVESAAAHIVAGVGHEEASA